MRRGLLSCPENTSRLYELLMSQLLIKYSIFVLYGREILVVIRVPPQRNAAVYQTRGENYSTDEDVNIGELYRPHAGTRNTRHGGTHCFDKRIDHRSLSRALQNGSTYMVVSRVSPFIEYIA